MRGASVSSPAALGRMAETSGVVLVTAGAVVWAHGLGGVPRLLEFELVNVTAQHGYTTGQRITIHPGSLDLANSYGLSVMRDATNVTLRFGASGSGGNMHYLHATSGAQVTLTGANWTLTERAFR